MLQVGTCGIVVKTFLCSICVAAIDPLTESNRNDSRQLLRE